MICSPTAFISVILSVASTFSRFKVAIAPETSLRYFFSSSVWTSNSRRFSSSVKKWVNTSGATPRAVNFCSTSSIFWRIILMSNILFFLLKLVNKIKKTIPSLAIAWDEIDYSRYHPSSTICRPCFSRNLRSRSFFQKKHDKNWIRSCSILIFTNHQLSIEIETLRTRFSA